MDRKIKKTLVGIACFAFGTYVMLELREHRAQVITESLNNQIKTLNTIGNEHKNHVSTNVEVINAKNAQKKAELQKEQVEAELAKIKAEKTNSDLCRFWKQQKSLDNSERVNEKIKTNCS